MTKDEAAQLKVLAPLVFNRDFFMFLKGDKVWYLGEGNNDGNMRVETDLINKAPANVPYDAVTPFEKLRRYAFYFSDGDVYYAEGTTADQAYTCVEGVLDDKDEDVECTDEVEIEEGTPEWDSFQVSFPQS